ncbi:MAG: hypothetical protein LBH60_04765, partial [Prevotellaceae bacterium]|nr:hypothetical protein [Prevotellaceae bacterium]
MKRITILRSFRLCIAMLTTAFFFSDVSFAQIKLLGQYEFTTGENQTKPSSVFSGLIFSDIIGPNSANHTSAYAEDALITTGWAANSQNIGAGHCVQFGIKINQVPNSIAKFHVVKVVLTYKRDAGDTSNKISLNAGPARNVGQGPNAYKPVQAKEFLFAGPDYETVVLEEGNPDLIPEIADASEQFIALAPQVGPTLSFYIDKIEVWGTTVTSLAIPVVTSDVVFKTLTAVKGHPITFPVTLTGSLLTQTTTLNVTGANAGYFQLDRSDLSASDLNAAPQTVNVTYNAPDFTYDAETQVNTPHLATLLVANSELESSIDIPLTASCYVMYEDFSNYDVVALANDGDMSVLPPAIPADVPLSIAPGWTGNNIYAYKTGKTAAAAYLASTSESAAYITTPAMDLSQPFTLSFKYKSYKDDVTDGILRVYLDDSQLIYEGENRTGSTIPIAVGPFTGAAT